jgi:hypothetical protein
MTLPNFFLIGPPRTASTSLYHWFKQHPQIYMSPMKEPNFLAFGPTQKPRYPQLEEKKASFAEYEALFDGVTNEKAVGEASVIYIFSPDAPQMIKRYCPGAKIIAVLRNPVDRAYSHYCAYLRWGWELRKDFSEVVESYREDVRAGKFTADHIQWGFYARFLRRYYEAFDARQIRVFLYDELSRNPDKVLQNILAFLEVDIAFAPDAFRRRHAIRKIPRSIAWQEFLRKPHPVKSALERVLPNGLRRSIWDTLYAANLGTKPGLQKELRREVMQIYKSDIMDLWALTGLDVSGWLSE